MFLKGIQQELHGREAGEPVKHQQQCKPVQLPCTANQHCNLPASLLTAGLSCWCHIAQPLSPWNRRRVSFGVLGFRGEGSRVWGEVALLRSSCLLILLWIGCLKLSWHWDTGQSHTLTQDTTHHWEQEHLWNIRKWIEIMGRDWEGWNGCLRIRLGCQ